MNASARQFRRPGLAAVVGKALQEHDLPPGAVHLEITESALFDDQPAVNANVAALTELGVQLELDDFGTGYSSLSRLQHLAVAVVKLDGAFISTIERSVSAQAVVRAAIEMSHALSKYVVAEGVEDAAQLALLKTMGCDIVQGYHLSQPLPREFAVRPYARPRHGGSPPALRPRPAPARSLSSACRSARRLPRRVDRRRDTKGRTDRRRSPG